MNVIAFTLSLMAGGVIACMIAIRNELHSLNVFFRDLLDKEETDVVVKKPVHRNASNAKHQSLSERQKEAMTYRAGDEV